MVEINAKTARSFSLNYKQASSEHWYMYWKTSFFDRVQKAALDGKREVRLPSSEWKDNPNYKHYLTTRLSILGYQTKNEEEELLVIW